MEQKVNLFVNPNNINLKRMAWVIGLTLLIWSGFAAYIPAKHYALISVILVTIDKAIAYLMRPDMYTTDRVQQ